MALKLRKFLSYTDNEIINNGDFEVQNKKLRVAYGDVSFEVSNIDDSNIVQEAIDAIEANRFCEFLEDITFDEKETPYRIESDIDEELAPQIGVLYTLDADDDNPQITLHLTSDKLAKAIRESYKRIVRNDA